MSDQQKYETGNSQASLQNKHDEAAVEADVAAATETVTFLTASEVAQRYRTSRNQVYGWTKEGRIPESCFIRIGRKLLFNAPGLTRWEAQGGSPINKTSQDDDHLSAAPCDTRMIASSTKSR